MYIIHSFNIEQMNSDVTEVTSELELIPVLSFISRLRGNNTLFIVEDTDIGMLSYYHNTKPITEERYQELSNLFKITSLLRK